MNQHASTIGHSQILNILETAMDGIVSIDARQNIVLFNSAAEAIFGWRSDDVIGRPIDILIPDQFRPQHRHDVERFGNGDVRNRRMGQQRTVLGLRSSGETFPMEASISQTTSDGEKIYTVIVRDVTEAFRYRQQISQQTQILDQISDAVTVVDREGRINYWNQAATVVFGWTADEAVGQLARDLFDLVIPEQLAEMLRETDRRLSWAGELSKSTRDGKRITVEHRRTVLRDASGLHIGYLCIDIDITDRKKRERASNRSQRLESIGTLAGGIAHDLNNVLTPILMGAKLLASGRAGADPQGLLTTMITSAQRGAELVTQLLSFAGGIRGERSPIRVDRLIAETRTILDHTLPKSIRIETTIDPNCPPVMGDVTELSQILMNLCINARDAMAEGGVLSIEASSFYMGGQVGLLHPDANPGYYVLLKVSDTGVGMGPELLDRIFDPFFTTKEIGKGTGLGLATVQGIVKSHAGFINVYSEVGRGSRFSVYLPAIEAATEVIKAATRELQSSGAGKSILLVDDEPSILQVAATVMELAGYRVLTARDGAAAISMFSLHHSEIAAVLLDLMMPGLDGMRTLDELRQIDSHIPIVACSGLRTAQREVEVIERGANAFLPKPYTEAQLLQALDVVTNGSAYGGG